MHTPDSFSVESPTVTIGGQSVKLRPVNQGFTRVIDAVSKLVGKEDVGEMGRATVIAYAAVYSLPPSEGARLLVDPKELELAIAEADLDLSNEDVAKVDEYLSGVFERARAASVEVQKPVPGKPSGTRTRRRP